ncbi:MAG: zinc ribbon domain-containing protein [Anaerolineales bacterium]|nr:zinc ribbon domain-containing protein [Anaerolineales bacterium]
MEEFLAKVPTYLTIVATICGGVTAALVGGMVIWTFRDIRSRSRDILAQILACVLVLVVPVVGLVVYLMLRPRETLAEAYERSLEEEALLQAIEEPEACPGCGQRIKGNYLFCPSCHTRLKRGCPTCGNALHLRWSICPYCGTNVVPQVIEPVVPQVAEPAAERLPEPPTAP